MSSHRNSRECYDTLVMVVGSVLRKVERFDFDMGNLLETKERGRGPLVVGYKTEILKLIRCMEYILVRYK